MNKAFESQFPCKLQTSSLEELCIVFLIQGILRYKLCFQRSKEKALTKKWEKVHFTWFSLPVFRRIEFNKYSFLPAPIFFYPIIFRTTSKLHMTDWYIIGTMVLVILILMIRSFEKYLRKETENKNLSYVVDDSYSDENKRAIIVKDIHHIHFTKLMALQVQGNPLKDSVGLRCHAFENSALVEGILTQGTTAQQSKRPGRRNGLVCPTFASVTDCLPRVNLHQRSAQSLLGLFHTTEEFRCV